MLFLLFQLDAERFALDIRQVAEVLPLLEMTRVPQAPPALAGILNYRGAPVPVIDLSQLMLNRPAQQRLHTRIVIVHCAAAGGATELLGVIAERATETLRIEEDSFKSWGAVDAAGRRSGSASLDEDGLIQRIDIERMLPRSVRELMFQHDGGSDAAPVMMTQRAALNDPDFAGLLKQAIGLDAASIGVSAIGHAVQLRKSACKVDDSGAYWDLVRTSQAELQALIDAVVVPETWFFRDAHAYAAMAGAILKLWPLRPQPARIRLLSLPCSTGEEPYSMAMTLLDAGIAPHRFDIDAMDISERSLAYARRATYGRNSFRGRGLEFRLRHFEATRDGHRLHDEVSRCVKFHHANLFSDDSLLGKQLYDVVFCRNLLIYFDRATQARAVQVLRRSLVSGGMLFVGPSETSLLLNSDFVSAKMPLAFAFHEAGPREPGRNDARPHAALAHRAASAKNRAPQSLRGQPPAHQASAPTHILPKPARAVAQPPPCAGPPCAGSPGAPNESGLGEASWLADCGRLSEAVAQCEMELRKHGPSAALFSLMGLIHAAAGDLEKAERCYRKALYLDPNHQDTLVHLAWLMEKRGDTASARQLRSRLSKLEQKPPN